MFVSTFATLNRAPVSRPSILVGKAIRAGDHPLFLYSFHDACGRPRARSWDFTSSSYKRRRSMFTRKHAWLLLAALSASLLAPLYCNVRHTRAGEARLADGGRPPAPPLPWLSGNSSLLVS